MIHPHTEVRLVSPDVGLGVFATQLIPYGTITWVLDPLDQIFDSARAAKLMERLQEGTFRRFVYRDGSGDTILLWDHARYICHSCDPNTAGLPDVTFSIAIRDIEPGEPLTQDYGEVVGFDAFPCQCGSPRCRGVVAPPGDTRNTQRDRVVVGAIRAGIERRLAQPLEAVGLSCEWRRHFTPPASTRKEKAAGISAPGPGTHALSSSIGHAAGDDRT